MKKVEQHTFIHQASEIGYYKVGVCNFHSTTKPNFIHRFFCKLILGFVWHDSGGKK